MRRAIPAIMIAASALACTPLGLWIYEEPTVEVTELRLDPAAGAEFPVQVALAVSNANDFEVSLVRVHMRVSVAGTAMLDRELLTAAAFRARYRLVVRMGVSGGDLATRGATRAAGSQPYQVDGFAVLRTPIGERRIPFTRAGTSA